MAKMPKRPRPHTLETEARSAFKRIVEPLGWVVRDFGPADYGVDDQVEVFDEEGTATGLQFYVQSRGTDKPLRQRATVRVRTAQQNYFRALGLPVLIARYHSPSGRTFVKWFHRFDPYPRQESQTISFDPADEIDVNSAMALADELRLIRFWSNSEVQWPLNVVISTSTERPVRSLTLAMFSLTHSTGVIRTLGYADAIVGEQETFPLSVTVSDNQIRTDAALVSHTFHVQTADLIDKEIALLVAFSVAVVLSDLRHHQKSSLLFKVALTGANFSPENIETAAIKMARGDQHHAVCEIAEHWIDIADTQAHLGPSFQLLNNFIANTNGVNIAGWRRAAELSSRLATLAQSLGSDLELPMEALLNAGRIYFRIGDWREAHRNLDQAIAIDPDRSNIVKEAAGAAHEAGDYSSAVALYTRAIALEPNNVRLKLRKADSLMQQGQLRASLAEFDAFFATEPESYETIWYLKAEACRFLVKSGMPDGDRNPAAAEEILARRTGKEADSRLDSIFLAAAKADPLNSNVWSAISDFELERGNLIRAAGPLSIAALIDRTSISWAKSITNAVRADLDDLALCATGQALFDHGDELHIALRDYLATSDDSQKILDYVDRRDVIESRPRKEDRRKTTS